MAVSTARAGAGVGEACTITELPVGWSLDAVVSGPEKPKPVTT